MDKNNSRIYYINSARRESGTNSRFNYKIQIPENSGFDRVCVLQASIPISFYLVQDGFNTFSLTENFIIRTVTVPVGNYNVQNFITTVLALLNTGTFVYTMAVSVMTGKFTYSVSGNSGSQPIFTFTSHLYQQFGFTENSVNTFVGDTMISTNVVNFIPEGTIFIHSNIVNEYTDVLQEIYSNNTVPFSNVIYQMTTDIDTYSKQLSTDRSNTFSFVIMNEDDQELDMNGQNLLLTLLLYKKNDLTWHFKKFAKWVVDTIDKIFNIENPDNNINSE